MNNHTLDKIIEQAQQFHDNCEQQHREIIAHRQAIKQKAREKEERKQKIMQKFEETMLQDLQAIFKETTSLLDTPHLQVALDTHLDRTYFWVYDTESIPAYAFLAIAAKSGEGEDEDAFSSARYLFFAVQANNEGYVQVYLMNDERDFVSDDGNEWDEKKSLASFSLDDYDTNEVKNIIHKYILEELNYYQENFRLEVEEEEEEK